MSMQAKKHENIPKNAKETTTERILSIKMSTKGAQVLHLACQEGGLSLAPQLVTPLPQAIPFRSFYKVSRYSNQSKR